MFVDHPGSGDCGGSGDAGGIKDFSSLLDITYEPVFNEEEFFDLLKKIDVNVRLSYYISISMSHISKKTLR